MMSGSDIYEFWRSVGPNDLVHPKDAEVFSRFGRDRHPFDLTCLPSCVWGNLRAAPVVLLYLSPGWNESDPIAAQSLDHRKYYVERRDGRTPLVRDDSHTAGLNWVKSRTNFIGNDWDQINKSVAILNIGAYHSKSVPDVAILASLPSSRCTLDWAQTVLFKEAADGKRVVICMRSARLWGLTPGNPYGGGLFCPNVNRAGHMLNDEMRAQVTKAIQQKLKPLSA